MSSHHVSAGRQVRLAPAPTAITPLGMLNRPAIDELEAISMPFHYPDGATLFREGEPGRGVFIVRSGRVKLLLSSGDGRTLIARMAKGGDVLGLPSTLSGRPYEVTAMTLGPCQLAFIKGEDFLRFMNKYKEVAIGVAQQLTSMYSTTCHAVRCLGLAHSVAEKLAALLLRWPLSNGDTVSRIKFGLHHEEVAQMIGSTRETVSRLFIAFKKRKLAELDGSTLYIRDRQLLQLIADGKTYVSPWAHRAEPPSIRPAEPAMDADTHFYTEGV